MKITLKIQPILHEVFLNGSIVIFPKKKFQNIFKHNHKFFLMGDVMTSTEIIIISK